MNGDKFLVLNMVGFATRFSMLGLLNSHDAMEVVRVFSKEWINWAGTPETVYSDHGSEFKGNFDRWANTLGFYMRIIPTESPWQHGLVERHGAVSNEVLLSIVEECTIQGRERDGTGNCDDECVQESQT